MVKEITNLRRPQSFVTNSNGELIPESVPVCVEVASQLLGTEVAGYLYFMETGEFHVVSVNEARVKQILKNTFTVLKLITKSGEISNIIMRRDIASKRDLFSG